MSDLGARALIISVIWASVGMAIAVGLAGQGSYNRGEVVIAIALFLTVGATAVSLVVWLTKWPKPYSGQGFEVARAEPVTPVVVAE